jgi:hypothetical protein
MTLPSRRQFLSAMSASGGALLTGCTGGPDDVPETSTGENTPTETSRSVPTFPDDTASATCPPFEAADTVVCYDAVDPEAMPLVMVPGTQSVRPDQPTEFTLRNRSGQRFQTNAYHWQLYKRVDGDWYYIAPESWPEPLTPLAAGEAHTWTVTIESGCVSDGAPIDAVQGTDSLSLAGLGGGQYAFATDGWFAAGSPDAPVALAASFELQADPLALTPTAAISETEWDSETLVARSTRGDPDDETERPDAYILDRLDDSEGDAEEVIAEQVVRDDQLRDTIALSREYDATRVRLEEYSSAVPPFRLDEARTYEFQGERYRVTTQDGGAS